MVKALIDYLVCFIECMLHHTFGDALGSVKDACVQLPAFHDLGLDARKPVFGGLQTTPSLRSDQHLCYSLFGKYLI